MPLPQARNDGGGLTRIVAGGSDGVRADIVVPSGDDLTAVFVITTAGPLPSTNDYQPKQPPWMATIPEFDDDEVYEQFRRNIRANRERYSDDEEVLP